MYASLFEISVFCSSFNYVKILVCECMLVRLVCGRLRHVAKRVERLCETLYSFPPPPFCEQPQGQKRPGTGDFAGEIGVFILTDFPMSLAE